MRYNIRPIQSETCALCTLPATHEVLDGRGNVRTRCCYDHCIEWIQRTEEAERIYSDAVHRVIEIGRR